MRLAPPLVGITPLDIPRLELTELDPTLLWLLSSKLFTNSFILDQSPLNRCGLSS